MGSSPLHASTVGLICNLRTNHISPQFHVVYDNLFETMHVNAEETPASPQRCGPTYSRSTDSSGITMTKILFPRCLTNGLPRLNYHSASRRIKCSALRMETTPPRGPIFLPPTTTTSRFSRGRLLSSQMLLRGRRSRKRLQSNQLPTSWHPNRPHPCAESLLVPVAHPNAIASMGLTLSDPTVERWWALFC
jgi:hypothetical protein